MAGGAMAENMCNQKLLPVLVSSNFMASIMCFFSTIRMIANGDRCIGDM